MVERGPEFKLQYRKQTKNLPPNYKKMTSCTENTNCVWQDLQKVAVLLSRPGQSCEPLAELCLSCLAFHELPTEARVTPPHFFGGSGVWVQCFVLSKQCSTTWDIPPVHFALVILGDGVSWTICLGWPQILILPISASQVARITGSSHQCTTLAQCPVLQMRKWAQRRKGAESRSHTCFCQRWRFSHRTLDGQAKIHPTRWIFWMIVVFLNTCHSVRVLCFLLDILF
jgi:hypothetical protein